MEIDEICENIKQAVLAWEDEMIEHNIYYNEQKLRYYIEEAEKSPSKIKKAISLPLARKTHQMYAGYIETYESIKKTMDEACRLRQKPSCDGVELIKREWEKERKKYAFAIFLLHKKKFYKDIIDNVDDVLASGCKRND